MAGLVASGRTDNGGREEVWRSDEPMDKLAESQEAVEGPLPRVTARSHTAPQHFPEVLFLLLDSCFCSYEWLMLCAADWCFLTSFICMSEWTLKGLWFSIMHTFWEKNITVLKNYFFTCHNFALTYSVLPPVFHSSSLFKLHPLSCSVWQTITKCRNTGNLSDVDINEVPRLFLQGSKFNSCCTT